MINIILIIASIHCRHRHHWYRYESSRVFIYISFSPSPRSFISTSCSFDSSLTSANVAAVDFVPSSLSFIPSHPHALTCTRVHARRLRTRSGRPRRRRDSPCRRECPRIRRALTSDTLLAAYPLRIPFTSEVVGPKSKKRGRARARAYAHALRSNVANAQRKSLRFSYFFFSFHFFPLFNLFLSYFFLSFFYLTALLSFLSRLYFESMMETFEKISFRWYFIYSSFFLFYFYLKNFFLSCFSRYFPCAFAIYKALTDTQKGAHRGRTRHPRSTERRHMCLYIS